MNKFDFRHQKRPMTLLHKATDLFISLPIPGNIQKILLTQSSKSIFSTAKITKASKGEDLAAKVEKVRFHSISNRHRI
jgi:hypothetical protein